MKVKIESSYDGFTILLIDEINNTSTRYYFNQEDGVERLVEVFEQLGYKAEHEDVY